MNRKNKIPEYDIYEKITIIPNPEVSLLEWAKENIIAINKDTMSEDVLKKLEERRTK